MGADIGAVGPRITIASNHFKTGRHAVDDTMVHEVIHARLYVTGKDVARRATLFPLGRAATLAGRARMSC
jgi:hypothetical protein